MLDKKTIVIAIVVLIMFGACSFAEDYFEQGNAAALTDDGGKVYADYYTVIFSDLPRN